MPLKPLARWFSRQHRIVLLWMIAPSLSIGIIALAMAFWRIPTQVVMHLQANSIEFSPAPDAYGSLWDGSLKFTDLNVQGLQRLSLPDDWLLRENGQLVDFISEGREWLGSESPRAALNMLSPGWLNEVKLKPNAMVRLEAARSSQLLIQWLDTAQTLTVFPENNLQLQGRYLLRTALDQPRLDDLELKASIANKKPFNLTLQPGAALTINAETLPFLPKILPVGQLAFKEQTAEGNAVCSLRGEITLRLLDFPGQAEKTVPAPAYCQVRSSDDDPLQLSGLRFNDAGDTLELTISGLAALLTFGQEDYRVNALEWLLANAMAVKIFTIVAWSATMGLGTYKLYKETGNK